MTNRTTRWKALFVSNLYPDSAECYRGLDNATVLEHLAEGCEFRVISPRPTLPLRGGHALQPRESDRQFQPNYLRVPYLPKIGSRINPPLMARSLRRATKALRRDFEFEIIVASWLYPDGWAATRIAEEIGVPSVLIAQGTDVHGYLQHPVRRKFILEAVEKAAATITRSRSLADLLVAAGADGQHVGAIHNGADPTTFHPRDRKATRRDLGIDPDGRLLLFVGNFLPVKNPLMLIEALGELRSSAAEVPKLVLIGQGPMESQIRSLAESLGIGDRISFTGGIPSAQVARWMAAADLLCMTSHNEGLPNVVIEALASGLRVLATDVGGIRELIDNERRGALVKPGDVSGFAERIFDLLEDEGCAAPDAKELLSYSWARCGAEYQAVIDRILLGGA